MAGHSQFKNIMHRKGAQDKKRSKLFTKLIREIVVAAKSGLADPASNPRLRSAIQAARVENMPKDKIDAAIKKASGEAGGDDYDEVRYEGYGPGGVAIIVQALTDNRNRTAADVRAAFAKAGGNMGESGSVSFMFDRVGRIEYPVEAGDEETMLDAAIEAGADNVESGPDGHVVTTATDSLHEVAVALERTVGEARSSRIVWVPKVGAPVDEEQAKGLMKLIDLLEDNDDVQEVIANFEIADDVLERLGA